MNHWLRNILILTLWTGCKGQDEVTQTGGDVTATEGDSVTLSCSYKTSEPYAYLFWYKQEVNDFPRFLLQRYSASKEKPSAEDRIYSTINETSSPLTIQNLQLSDSAVYYCALRPTVTGNTKTLYKNLWSKDNTVLHNSH
ncbi:uncharacterized protein V6R79_018018 [Siganus canaliculatus]